MPSSTTSKEILLAKCDYFREVNLWPRREELNAENWLENFSESEQPHAIQLLNSFAYFSDDLIDEMFAAAFHGLSAKAIPIGESLLRAQSAWRNFVDSVIITYPTGEKPSVTDSGFTFARKARQVLQIPEERIKSPEAVLDLLFRSGPSPVVFVDDFVGTGNQFIHTWFRTYDVPSARSASFFRFALVRGAQFFYCPIFCTQFGFDELQRRCRDVTLSPAHILSPRYSAIAPDSLLWTDNLRPYASQFLEAVSKRAGIPDTGGTTPNDWRGFGKLGLALALGGSVPDATLPILYWEQNGWRPLIRRT